MEIPQTFYDDMAGQCDRLFRDWRVSTRKQAAMLDGILAARCFGRDGGAPVYHNHA